MQFRTGSAAGNGFYTHETGRFLMKGLINPHISEIGAVFLEFSGLQSANCVVYPEEQDSDVFSMSRKKVPLFQ